jgi:hypothetical protein
MPVHKCPNGKFKIGSGKCMYDSKAKAEAAYRGYLAKKHEDLKYELISELGDLKKIELELNRIKELIKHGNDKRI